MSGGDATAGESEAATDVGGTDAVTLDAIVLPAFANPDLEIDELRPWLDRRDLPDSVAVAPHGEGYHSPLYHDGRVGVVATGIGPAAAATTVATLLADSRIDCGETLFVTAGVAGAPPDRATLGSTFVHDAVVDWDAKHRYHPTDLPAGERAVALHGFRPRDYRYDLNDALVERALDLATHVDLLDGGFDDEVADRYPDRCGPNAPHLGRGTTVAGAEFWHGGGVAAEVEWLVDQYDAGSYVTTECEESGTATALYRHGALDRYLSIRAVSNFDRPPGDVDLATSTHKWENALPLAVENAYRVASAVVDDRLGNPDAWRTLY